MALYNGTNSHSLFVPLLTSVNIKDGKTIKRQVQNIPIIIIIIRLFIIIIIIIIVVVVVVLLLLLLLLLLL